MAKIFGVLLGIIIFQASVQAADKIRVAMPAEAGHFTLPLAQKRGFLKEEGIEAEIVTISGPVANIALASGEIDYFTGFGSAMRAMVQGQLPEDGFRRLIEDTKSVTQIRRDVALYEVSDLSILKGAQRELGITVK